MKASDFMINSISETYNKNIFNDISAHSQNQKYWLLSNENKYKHSEKDIVKSDNFNPYWVLNPDEARKTNNFKIIGLSIAGATLFSAAAIFFLLKGGPKGLAKNFEKMRDALEKKVQKAKLNNMSDTPVNRAYIFMLRHLDKVVQRSAAVNNFTSIKDMLFRKIMFVTPYTGKIHDGITRIFEKIGRQAVVNSYKSVGKAFKTRKRSVSEIASKILLNEPNEKLTINGVTKTKVQWLNHLTAMNEDIDLTYLQNFGQSSLTSRYMRMKKSAQNVRDYFTKMKNFLSGDLLNKFMADSELAKERVALQKRVKMHRNKLSYSVEDLGVDFENKLIEMTKSIGHKDIKQINMLRNVRRTIGEFVQSGGNDVKLKNEVLKSINDFRTEVVKSLSAKNVDEKTAQRLINSADELSESFSSFKQGKVQDILELYQKLLSKEDFELVKKAYSENIKTLDKAINVETEDFLNKVRDLYLGSAPTDILTILGSLATLGYHLGKSDSNEQRVSISLKYGIPALSGVATSLYFNAKLFAGSKALLCGAASVFVVNRIGTWADNMFKKYNAKKQAQV